MYEIFKDLLKLAEESMEVQTCHLRPGDMEILGSRDGKTVRIRYEEEGHDPCVL